MTDTARLLTALAAVWRLGSPSASWSLKDDTVRLPQIAGA